MKMSFNKFLILFYGLLSFSINAQTNLIGKVLNSEYEPLPFSNVILFDAKEYKIYSGTSTNEEGLFIIKNVNAGDYFLRITYVGYEKQIINNIYVSNKEKEIDLGMILLYPEEFQLSDIVVRSSFGVTNLSPGKVSYNTNNLVSQKGGTGGDILKNMPSVFMGGSPNHNRDVRYRGLGNAYTQVLINGRKAGISGNNRESVVDMLPAERIDYIEIISNPTSDFQADGINGLINIVTKGNIKPMFHGSISGGLDNNEGYSGNISLFNSLESVGFGIQASRLKRLVDKPKDVEKINYKVEAFDGTQYQNELEKKHFLNDFVKGNIKYRWNSQTNFLFETSFGNQKEIKQKDVVLTAFKPDNMFKENKKEKTDEKKNNKYNEYYSEFNHTFMNFSELRISLGYNSAIQTTDKSSSENKYNINGQLLTPAPSLKNENEGIKTKDLSGNINYKFRLDKIGMIKVGYSYFSISRDAEKQKLEFNYSKNAWVNKSSGVDNFNIIEKTHALFIDAKISFGNFHFNPGLRIENTKLSSFSVIDEKNNIGNYILAIPLANVIYNIDTTQYFTLSFGRRIRRPGFNDLNPFVDTSDPLKIKFGNPSLRPEKAWLYEIGYMKNFSFFNVGINVFYRDIKDVIQKVINVNDEGVFIESPENFSSGYLGGLEFITAFRISGWWQLNGAYSTFDSKVTDANYDGDALKDQVKWTAKIISDIKLPSEFYLQVASNFIGPKPSLFNYEEKIFSVDAGITKVIPGYGEINLRITDLFDSLKKVKYTRSGLSTSREVENTTGRIVTLTTLWNF